MDPIIQMMLQGYLDGLANRETDDDALRQEIDAFKKELLSFGESQHDPALFFPNFQESGLMGQFIALSTKITLAAQAAKEAVSGAREKKPLATPAEWLEPFRKAYDDIKDIPARERGLAAYRRLFAVGEKHAADIT